MTETVIASNTGEIETAIDVSYERVYDTSADVASFKVLSEVEKNALSKDEAIKIKDNNTTVFRGFIREISNSQPFEVKIDSKFKEFFNFDVKNRVFYEVNTGKARRQAIKNRTEELGLETVNTGDSLTDFSANVPVFELADFTQISPSNFGTDSVFAGFPKDNTNQINYNIDIDNVDFSGDEFQKIILNLFINNQGSVFDFSFEYQSNSKNYRWNLSRELDGREKIELRPEEAISSNTTVSTDKRFRINIKIAGQLLESLAILVDAVQINSYNVKPRDLDIQLDIDDTDREITRNVDKSVNNFISTLDESDSGNTIYEPVSDKITYKEKNEGESDIVIDDNLPIFDLDIVEDKSRLKNRVNINGDGFKIRVDDSNSISFYNDTVRKSFRSNQAIKRESDAIQKAEGILSNNAFNDRYIVLNLPPIKKAIDAKVGSTVVSKLSDIQGEFYIRKKARKSDGKIHLEIEAPRN